MSVRFGSRAGRLCALLGIDVPIVQAPMAGGWTTPELAAAVSGAGGLGMLAAARLTAEQLERQIGTVRDLTDRPFGVNFLLAPPEPAPDEGRRARAREILAPLRAEVGDPVEASAAPTVSELPAQLELVVRENVPIVSFAMGLPGPELDTVRAAATTVVGTATTPEEAAELESLGVDVLVLQSAEAGGHRSTFDVEVPGPLPLVGMVALLPRVADVTDLPILASGGIMDGRGLAAALCLGASGVQMGTRFLAAFESGAFPAYRRWLSSAGSTDTRVTRVLTGWPARALRNRLVEHLESADAPPLPWPHQSVVANDLYAWGMRNGDERFAPLMAGQGAGPLADERPAAVIVEGVAERARQVFEELS